MCELAGAVMYNKTLGAFLRYSFVFALIIILGVLGMRFAKIDSGQLIDWIAGMLSFWWMLVITTVPWNVYFEAKSVLHEFQLSQNVGIEISEKKRQYVQKVSLWGLWLAVGLHIFTAVVMFELSALGISRVGYIGCAVALLLTLLRPAIRAHEFIWSQLHQIKETVKYPRQDVAELRDRVGKLEFAVEALETSMKPDVAGSFAYELQNNEKDLARKYERLVAEQARLNDQNVAEHESLKRDGQAAIAKISSDTQFLDHVREIIRLVKSA